MAISTLYPSSRPSLTLDFAKSKRLDPRISFSRTHTGSIASYTDANGLIRFAGPDEPRFDHDPETGESLGLLVEESRTNLNTISDFSSGWSRIGFESVLKDAIGPDGQTNSAISLLEISGTNPGQYVIYRDFNVTNNNQVFTHSVFIKEGLRDEFQLNLHNVGSGGNTTSISLIYNTTTETFQTAEMGGPNATSLVGYGVIKYPNGWYRIWASGNLGNSDQTTTNIRFHVRTLENNGSYIGSGQIAGYIYGAQIELGSFPTSYIPTSGSSVTRPDDIVSIRNLQDADWWDPQVDSFSMSIEWDSPITLDPAIHGTVYGYLSFWSDSTNFDNRIGIPLPQTNSTTALTRAFGAGGAMFNNGTFTASSQDEFKKMAFRYSIPDYSDHTTKVWKIYYNSGDTSYTVAGNSNGTTVPSINRLGIGNNPTRFDEPPGIKTFKKLTIYNSVLPDSQLQTLTK